MPTHRVMRVVRPAFGAEVSQFFFKSVGRQPEAQLQASRGILRRADNVISHPDCCFKRRGVTLGVARVVRAVAPGAPSHRRAGTARPSSPLHGGAALHVQAVRGRAAAAQALSPCGVGPVRARRSATVVRAAPFVVRAARDAPRPLRLESGRRAAPLPAGDECGFRHAPQPLTAECGKVRSVARARGAPRQFTETIARRTTLSAVVKLYYIMWQRHVRVCAAGPRPGRGRTRVIYTHGVGPVLVRRTVTAVRAVPFVPRAAINAPRPLGLESSGRAAPLPVRDECGWWNAPQPMAAECSTVKPGSRARGAPRQFATHAARRFSKAEAQADELLAELPPGVLAVVTAGEAGSQLPLEAARALVRCALLVKGGPEGGTTRKGL